jgi:hypothetical protein
VSAKRLACAVLAVGVGVAAAVWIGSYRAHRPCPTATALPYSVPTSCGYPYRPSWVKPLAVLVGFGGVAFAVGIVAARRQEAA